MAQARQIGHTQWARHCRDITVFDLTGTALQDMAVARLVHERSPANGSGLNIEWPWQLTHREFK